MYVFYVNGFHSMTPGLSLFTGKVGFLKLKTNQHAGVNSGLTSRSGKGNIKAVEDAKQTHKSTHCGFLHSSKIVFGSVL